MLASHTFLAPKEGEELEDCQDSIHPDPTNNSNEIFAVSDGSTTSFFPGIWARILTRRFAENPDKAFDDWPDWLGGAQTEWKAEIQRRAKAENASFFTRNDFLSGKPAAATFVGLKIEKRADHVSWKALILGDSCIFHLAKDEMIPFPLKESTQFSNLVKTAESYPRDSSHLPEPLPLRDIQEGDTILITSDAFAKWLLLRNEKGLPLWGTVLSLTNPDEFTELIKKARAEEENGLENDDVALAVIRYGEPHECYNGQQFTPAPSHNTTASASPPAGHSKTPISPIDPPSSIEDQSNQEPRSIAKPISQVILGLVFLIITLAAVTFALSYRLLHETKLTRSTANQVQALSNQLLFDDNKLRESNLQIEALQRRIEDQKLTFTAEDAQEKVKQTELKEIATRNRALEEDNHRLRADLDEVQFIATLAGTSGEIMTPKSLPLDRPSVARPSASP